MGSSHPGAVLQGRGRSELSPILPAVTLGRGSQTWQGGHGQSWSPAHESCSQLRPRRAPALGTMSQLGLGLLQALLSHSLAPARRQAAWPGLASAQPCPRDLPAHLEPVSDPGSPHQASGMTSWPSLGLSLSPGSCQMAGAETALSCPQNCWWDVPWLQGPAPQFPGAPMAPGPQQNADPHCAPTQSLWTALLDLVSPFPSLLSHSGDTSNLPPHT